MTKEERKKLEEIGEKLHDVHNALWHTWDDLLTEDPEFTETEIGSEVTEMIEVLAAEAFEAYDMVSTLAEKEES